MTPHKSSILFIICILLAISSSGAFTISSTAFEEGEEIPAKYTYSLGNQCNGDNYSPPLDWSGAPAGVQSFAIRVIDPDGGDWVHWIQFNIPSNVSSLQEAQGGPSVGIQGTNSFGNVEYGGPCPPSGTHRYIFTIFALDKKLSLSSGASLSDFESEIEGHILGEAELTGTKSATT